MAFAGLHWIAQTPFATLTASNIIVHFPIQLRSEPENAPYTCFRSVIVDMPDLLRLAPPRERSNIAVR